MNIQLKLALGQLVASLEPPLDAECNHQWIRNGKRNGLQQWICKHCEKSKTEGDRIMKYTTTIEYLTNNVSAIDDWINKPIPSDLKTRNRNAYDYILTLKSGCFMVNWSFSDNYGNWDYWHCINKSGGVFPYSFDYLRKELEKL